MASVSQPASGQTTPPVNLALSLGLALSANGQHT
jgi:hypothetical protein